MSVTFWIHIWMVCRVQPYHIQGPTPSLLTCWTPQGFATHYEVLFQYSYHVVPSSLRHCESQFYPRVMLSRTEQSLILSQLHVVDFFVRWVSNTIPTKMQHILQPRSYSWYPKFATLVDCFATYVCGSIATRWTPQDIGAFRNSSISSLIVVFWYWSLNHIGYLKPQLNTNEYILKYIIPFQDVWGRTKRGPQIVELVHNSDNYCV